MEIQQISALVRPGCRRIARWIPILVLLAPALLHAGSPVDGHPPATESADLLALMDQRLQLMEQVAAYKWLHELPIEDLEREDAVVQSSIDAALDAGMTPATAAAFFRAQIEAAKAVQAYWFSTWQLEGAPRRAPDLVSDTRPRLLRLGADIIQAAGEAPRSAWATLPRARFDAAVQTPGLDETARSTLYDAVRALEFFPNRLRQVMATGRLRVGTTGDYPPFSHAEPEGREVGQGEAFAGIDIDLARDLASSLGVEAVLVRTTWPSLLDDLQAGRYDIAMSGVSRTLARQRVGFLSPPYYVGGKTPIARCEQASAFDSLEKIDRQGVRIIVNPGGTNEAFVRQHIRQAAVLVFPDNREIFRQIAAGQADVMITDRVEVMLQTALHPTLCATMDGNLNYQEKAFLMPQDPVWSEYVATWLSLRQADGTMAEIFRHHGVPPSSNDPR